MYSQIEVFPANRFPSKENQQIDEENCTQKFLNKILNKNRQMMLLMIININGHYDNHNNN